MKKIFLFVAALACSMTGVMAADFSVNAPSGQKLYFNITDAVNNIVYIVAGEEMPTGDLVIPATVNYDSKTYTVEGIDDDAFKSCEGLTSVTFPTDATFTTIGVSTTMSFVFMNCKNIKSFVIPDNVTSLGGQAFRETGITSVSFGAGVTKIPEDLFFFCYSLKHVVLPNNVTSIGATAFGGSGVTYLELGNAIADGFNAKSLGYGSGWYKTDIDTLVMNTVVPPTVSGEFDATLTSRCILYVPVGSKAAYKAKDGWKQFKYILEMGEVLTLHEITISVGYTSVEKVWFKLNGTEYSSSGTTFKCVHDESYTVQIFIDNKYYGLKQAMLGETDVTAQFDADLKATFVATEDAVLSFSYEQLIHPYDFTEVIPSGQTLYFKIIDAVNNKVAVCNQSGGRSISGYVSEGYVGDAVRPSGNVVIPETITHDEVLYAIEELDTLAFYGCMLSSLTLHDHIKAIRACALEDNYIGYGLELVIPADCKRIEEGAFRNCSYNAVNTGGAEIIEELAFMYCPLTTIKTTSALKEIYAGVCKRPELKTVELGENVEFVSYEAFANSPNIEEVTILATTPPEVSYKKGGSVYDEWRYFDPAGMKLVVPWSADHSILNAYKEANCWKLFGTIVEKSSETAIDSLTGNRSPVTHKLIKDGQLLILRDGKTYTVTGQEVK